MKYCSTRGGIEGWSFEQALFSPGYLEDGGLILPESIPLISNDKLREWAKFSYTELCKAILPIFIGEEEIPREDLHEIIEKAHCRLTHKDKIYLARLKDGLNILEAWHGPTLAFKDLSMVNMALFLEYFLRKQGRHITIVVSTSGDTGSSALESVRGLECIDVVVLLPRGRCTNIQELMMTTVIEDNVHVFSVDGTSDEIDIVVKKVCTDAKFKSSHNLCTMNSINWGRVSSQLIHYFYAYFRLCESCDREVEFIVPTGGCGNITAGCVAKKMGLPIKFVTAVNVNDIVYRLLSYGDFSLADEVIPTVAPAMDIQLPYNMERIFWLFSDGDSQLVVEIMKEFETSGKVKLPEDLQKKIYSLIGSFRTDDKMLLQTIKQCWDKNNYIICPHTAAAVCYIYQNAKSLADVLRICVATASPEKFPETIKKAGVELQLSERILSLKTQPTKFLSIEKNEDWDLILRSKIEEITQAYSKKIH